MIFAFVALVALDLVCLWLSMRSTDKLREDFYVDVVDFEKRTDEIEMRLNGLEKNSHPSHDADSVPVWLKASDGSVSKRGQPVLRGSAGKPGDDLGGKRPKKKATGRKPASLKDKATVDVDGYLARFPADSKRVRKNNRVGKRK